MTATAGHTFAVIAGGGTAGHVVPGLAIAQALVSRGHPPESIRYVGSERGIEARLVPAAGFPLTLLPGRGIQRRLTVETLRENVGALVGLGRAGVAALSLLRAARPRAVVSLGGYASVPCATAAVALRVPIVVQEQNAVPGAANRLVARFARACAVAFPGTPLPRATVTGNPVRPEVLAVDRNAGQAAARDSLGLPPRPPRGSGHAGRSQRSGHAGRDVVAVVGGSLGALRLNRAVLDALPAWAGRADLCVYHVVGERDWELVTAAVRDAPPPEGLDYRPVRYEDRMPLLLAAADVFVCRAGATTVSELAAVGVPAVLVPLPTAPGDHQTANARVLADGGAAVLVPDGDLDGPRLVAEVDSLLVEPERLAAMGKAAAALGQRDAADRVAALVEEHASWT